MCMSNLDQHESGRSILANVLWSLFIIPPKIERDLLYLDYARVLLSDGDAGFFANVLC